MVLLVVLLVGLLVELPVELQAELKTMKLIRDLQWLNKPLLLGMREEMSRLTDHLE